MREEEFAKHNKFVLCVREKGYSVYDVGSGFIVYMDLPNGRFDRLGEFDTEEEAVEYMRDWKCHME